jgi:hypothetical protein
VGAKLVRAITYLASGTYIEPDYEIATFFLNALAAQPIEELIQRYGVELHRGPGIRICRAVVPDDGTTALFSIHIWGTLRMYTVVKRDVSRVEQTGVQA